MAKYTHLIFDERLKIQALLLESISFRQIARELHKDPSTISKEIRNHLRFVKIGSHGKVFNDCLYAKECAAQHLCQDKNVERTANTAMSTNVGLNALTTRDTFAPNCQTRLMSATGVKQRPNAHWKSASTMPNQPRPNTKLSSLNRVRVSN
ncbi:helix-turn-helix domain-containing protein [Proteiniclasticum sp. QWL-01]|uniref:helix-turn-helix domain-containing protein n=1 Tax=Proteiniclasticum sp. QWL-01 TaxID=3036945 RepID=UPI002411467F|nr:helix-turn-helix domain-containing protein [Proteiniclasticum sp. QWL-01]WFF74293.1 helix-turn-helix domain-containing protein [Proteiniclasticum sp. QWL-01]